MEFQEKDHESEKMKIELLSLREKVKVLSNKVRLVTGQDQMN